MSTEIIQIGPASAWLGLVRLAPAEVYTPAAKPVVGVAPGADWRPLDAGLLNEAVKITLDRKRKAFTPAGEPMPTLVYTQGLAVMCDVIRHDVPLELLALQLGYSGAGVGFGPDVNAAPADPAVQTGGVQADATEAYSRAAAAANAILELDPNDYRTEADVPDTGDDAIASSYRSLLVRGPSPLKAGKMVQLFVPYVAVVDAVELTPGMADPMPVKGSWMAFNLDSGASKIALEHGVA